MRKDKKMLIIFCLPAVVMMLMFFLIPAVKLVVDSFFKYDISNMAGKSFVGFKNFLAVFTSPKFVLCVANTVKYVVIAVTIEFILGLLLALMLNVGFKGSQIMRTLMLTPLMMAPLVAGLVWKYLLSDQFGIINWGLYKLGIINNVHSIMWLSNPKISLYYCIIADTWLCTPFMMLVLLAGLQGIDPTYYEAARIDGAGTLKLFYHITLPLLKPNIVIAIIIRVMDALRSFDTIWAMTQGGPNFSSEVISTYIYKANVRFGQVGEASAMAVIFMLALLVLASIFIKKVWNPNED